MVDLQKYLNKLIDFYSELKNLSNPYFEETTNFLNNDSYIYSFVVKDMVILRQFIKTKTNIYSNATNLSLIPLNKEYFFKPLYWKGMVKQGSVHAENRCLISHINLG